MITNHLKWFAFRTFFLAACIVFAGCGSERPEVDELTEARYFLNQGNYQKAVVILKKLHQNASDNADISILYSSALAGSVGLNAIDSFTALEGSLFDKPIASQNIGTDRLLEATYSNAPVLELLVDPNAQKDPLEENLRKVEEFERSLLDLGQAIEEIGGVLTQLPYIRDNDRLRLIEAMRVLKDVGEEKGEDYIVSQVYLSVISLVQFLSYFRDAIPASGGKVKGRLWYKQLFCRMDVKTFVNNLSDSAYFLSLSFKSLNEARRQSSSRIYGNLRFISISLDHFSQVSLTRRNEVVFVNALHKLAQNAQCN